MLYRIGEILVFLYAKERKRIQKGSCGNWKSEVVVELVRNGIEAK